MVIIVTFSIAKRCSGFAQKSPTLYPTMWTVQACFWRDPIGRVIRKSTLLTS